MQQHVNSKNRLKSLAQVFVMASLLMLLPLGGGALAGTALTVLHSFENALGQTDGAYPVGGVIADKESNLYGPTSGGNFSFSHGTVFKLSPGGIESVIYSLGCPTFFFCRFTSALANIEGEFYGTYVQGFKFPSYSVYELSPAGLFKVVRSFFQDSPSELIALKRNLYGTTFTGSAAGFGTVFKLSRSGAYTQLYAFSCPDYPNCSDGVNPSTGLSADQHGNLYGTTSSGGGSGCGGYGCGVIFKLAPAGTYTVLYSFNGDEGSPSAAPIPDGPSDLYGMTQYGGAKNLGAVYKLSADGTYKVLHSFKGRDGANPQSGLIADGKGNLYGMTDSGGAFDGGTVFKISPTGVYRVLYSFCSLADCSDGSHPAGRLMAGRTGNLYGTTVFGGRANIGTVFKLSGTGFVP